MKTRNKISRAQIKDNAVEYHVRPMVDSSDLYTTTSLEKAEKAASSLSIDYNAPMMIYATVPVSLKVDGETVTRYINWAK
jgi:hypothetical protein